MPTKPKYDALMDDYENEAALDCGCLLWRGDNDGTIRLTWCAAHRAVPDLLAAARDLWARYSRTTDWRMHDLEPLRAAIAKAEGPGPTSEAVGDCGCRLEKTGGGLQMRDCSLHAAASDLLKAAKDLVDGDGWATGKMLDNIRAAIAKAEAPQ